MALEISNEELFKEVVSDAIASAIINCRTEALIGRWERAIDRAVLEIERNPFLHYDSEAAHLVILSSSSNNVYSANGVCQCLAFLNGKQPCWHRAAARLWRLYLEAENKPLPPAKAAAVAVAAAAESGASREPHSIPYLKPSGNYKTTKVGNVRV